MRALGWLGVVLVASCAPGLGSVQTWTRRTLAADLRLADMCEGVNGAAPMMGFDEKSLERFKAAAKGEVTNFQPFDELAGACNGLSNSSYYKKLEDLRVSVQAASVQIDAFAKKAVDFSAWVDVASCSKSQLSASASGQQSGSCTANGANQLFYATKGQKIQEIADIEAKVDELFKNLPDELKSATAGCPEQAEQARRAIVAYAALASDAAHILRWIAAFTNGDTASLY